MVSSNLHSRGKLGHPAIRDHLNNTRQVPRKDTYISGYWKIGLVEDEHQKMKRAEAA
jgi:hypothetical protein